VIQCLRARSATTIIVAEVARERQNFTKMFGATHIFDPRSEDVVKKSKEICAGQGPKITFDCADVPVSIKTAVLAVRPGGTAVNVAI
jgi:(R,R)-butanediol dehydrogenase/meso-butanediol dehydrogenase/diacetyl reductase